jgi:hypothetical protein
MRPDVGADQVLRRRSSSEAADKNSSQLRAVPIAKKDSRPCGAVVETAQRRSRLS